MGCMGIMQGSKKKLMENSRLFRVRGLANPTHAWELWGEYGVPDLGLESPKGPCSYEVYTWAPK